MMERHAPDSDGWGWQALKQTKKAKKKESKTDL